MIKIVAKNVIKDTRKDEFIQLTKELIEKK